MPTIRQESEDDDMPWPDDDFTGEWIVEWPNGEIKTKSNFLRGQADGAYLSYWANGNLAQKGAMENGVCKGVWEDFWENGAKFKETYYEDSKNFTVRWMDGQGRIEKVSVFRDGRLQESRKGGDSSD